MSPTETPDANTPIEDRIDVGLIRLGDHRRRRVPFLAGVNNLRARERELLGTDVVDAEEVPLALLRRLPNVLPDAPPVRKAKLLETVDEPLLVRRVPAALVEREAQVRGDGVAVRVRVPRELLPRREAVDAQHKRGALNALELRDSL